MHSYFVMKLIKSTTIKSYIFCIITVIILILSSNYLHAQSSRNLYDSLTLNDIMKIMESEGYFVRLYPEKGIIGWVSGTKKEDNISVSFISVYEPNTIHYYTYEEFLTTYDEINDWNKSGSYGKIYIDSDSHQLVLDQDLDLTGGVTLTRIIDFFKECDKARKLWLKTFK